MKYKALEICLKISEAGGKAYYTGGCVRDMLLERPFSDIDIEVFGINRETLEEVLEAAFGKEVDEVGKSYGVYKVGGIDVSLARIDHSHGHGAVVAIDPFMSVEEAARRRDITINAIYFDPSNMEVVDPFGGRNSLRNRVISQVSADTFNDDPLRPIRAARFSSTLEFDIDYNTLVSCRTADRAKLSILPKDRVMGELAKVLLGSRRPSRFFYALEQMGLLGLMFPDLEAMKAVEQGSVYHPEGNVFNHLMLAIDKVPMEDRTLEIMLATLFHDLGKRSVPTVVDGGKISFHGHAEETKDAEKALSRLTDDVKLTKSVLSLIKAHMRPYDFKHSGVTRKLVKRLALSVDIPKLMVLHKADREGRGESEETRKYVDDNVATANAILETYEEIKNAIHPLVQGRDLIDSGFIPGKHFGEILKELYERQLDDHFDTVEGGIKVAKALFREHVVK